MVVENGSPFLFKDAAHIIGRMKLFLDGTTPDVSLSNSYLSLLCKKTDGIANL